jgi:hypothetical protein
MKKEVVDQYTSAQIVPKDINTKWIGVVNTCNCRGFMTGDRKIYCNDLTMVTDWNHDVWTGKTVEELVRSVMKNKHMKVFVFDSGNELFKWVSEGR